MTLTMKSPKVVSLAHVLVRIVNGSGEHVVDGRDLWEDARDIELEVEETFTPNLIDPTDAPIFDRERVTYLCSLDRALLILQKEQDEARSVIASVEQTYFQKGN